MIKVTTKIRYTLNWRKLINKYNNENLGLITQSRLAELFDVSGACVSLDQTEPKRLETLVGKYPKYEMMFGATMHFNDLLIKHEL